METNVWYFSDTGGIYLLVTSTREASISISDQGTNMKEMKMPSSQVTVQSPLGAGKGVEKEKVDSLKTNDDDVDTTVEYINEVHKIISLVKKESEDRDYKTNSEPSTPLSQPFPDQYAGLRDFVYIEEEEEEPTRMERFHQLISEMNKKMILNKKHEEPLKTSIHSGFEARIQCECSVDETMKKLIPTMSAMSFSGEMVKVRRDVGMARWLRKRTSNHGTVIVMVMGLTIMLDVQKIDECYRLGYVIVTRLVEKNRIIHFVRSRFDLKAAIQRKTNFDRFVGNLRSEMEDANAVHGLTHTNQHQQNFW